MARKEDLLWLTRRLHLAPRERIRPLRWRPSADVYRTQRGWLVKFELAGVEEEAVEVTLSGRWLLLRGSRFDIDCVEGFESHALEIAYSHFERAVELPVVLDRARLETEFRRGMFLVHVITEGSAS